MTPPINDNDVFIDTDEVITSYLYDSEPIAESLLPPIFYAKRGDKRIKLDSISNTSSPSKKTGATHISSNSLSSIMATQSNKLNTVKMENVLMPRPLFDKTNAALIKLRRDIKMQKLKGWPNYKLDVIKSTLPIQSELTFNRDDWLPNDDFIVLHVNFIYEKKV